MTEPQPHPWRVRGAFANGTTFLQHYRSEEYARGMFGLLREGVLRDGAGIVSISDRGFLIDRVERPKR